MIRSILWRLLEPLVQTAIAQQVSAFEQALVDRRENAETERQYLCHKMRAGLQELGPIGLLPSQESYPAEPPQHLSIQQQQRPIAQDRPPAR